MEKEFNETIKKDKKNGRKKMTTTTITTITKKNKNQKKKKKKKNLEMKEKEDEVINDDDNEFEEKEKKNQMVNEKLGIGFRCDFSSTQVKVMLARGWNQIIDPNDTSWHLWWCETNDARNILDSKLKSYQKIPHFRNHYELTRKNYLYRNLKRYKKLLTKSNKELELELCDSMPITFELPSEYRMFVEEYQKQPGSTWIVKPVSRSQGKGIFLFRRLKDLNDWKLSRIEKEQSEGLSAETFVVQKYIDDPYLLAGRKFDLRIYVLVTSFHPLKVWLAREGFARLSSQPFDLNNINDNRVHLTNMAIQLKRSKDDDELMDKSMKDSKRTCKWSLIKFREYLTARHGVNKVETLLQRIAGVIMASLLAVQPVMMQGRNSFELYGYDVILDESLTPWLLEVNASPSLSATDTEDYRLKFDLIDDVLNVLDLEHQFTTRETRIGGFDLIWYNDSPVWITQTNTSVCGHNRCFVKKLNVLFLGSKNDRIRQLKRLREILLEIKTKK